MPLILFIIIIKFLSYSGIVEIKSFRNSHTVVRIHNPGLFQPFSVLNMYNFVRELFSGHQVYKLCRYFDLGRVQRIRLSHCRNERKQNVFGLATKDKKFERAQSCSTFAIIHLSTYYSMDSSSVAQGVQIRRMRCLWQEQKPMLEVQIEEIMCQHVPNINGKQIKIQRLSGLTNVTYSVIVDHAPLYVFKVFSDGFDRETENKVVQQLSDLQLSPNLIHAEQTFRIQEFLGNTRHPNQQDFSNIQVLERIVKHIHNFHQVSFTQIKETLSDYLFSQKQIKELYKYRGNKSQKGNTEAYNSLFNYLEGLLSNWKGLSKELLPQTKDSLRLCHNDLNNLNILFNKQQMHFIDYDYVGVNYLAYDIANFLNETTIDYCTEDYPGFLSVKKITFEEISTVSRLYPGYYPKLQVDVLKFMCVANLYWAVWSVKRFDLNKSEGFGVAEHGILRLKLYQHYKAMLSNLQQK